MLTMFHNAYDEYHAAWVRESVDLEAYTRMGKILIAMCLGKRKTIRTTDLEAKRNGLISLISTKN